MGGLPRDGLGKILTIVPCGLRWGWRNSSGHYLRPFIPGGPKRELYDAAMYAWLPAAYKLPFSAHAPSPLALMAGLLPAANAGGGISSEARISAFLYTK